MAYFGQMKRRRRPGIAPVQPRQQAALPPPGQASPTSSASQNQGASQSAAMRATQPAEATGATAVAPHGDFAAGVPTASSNAYQAAQAQMQYNPVPGQATPQAVDQSLNDHIIRTLQNQGVAQQQPFTDAIDQYVTNTLGRDGIFTPEQMQAQRDRLTREIRRSMLGAAGAEGTFGGSILSRNIGESTGNAVLDLQMQNALEGERARQAAAQMGYNLTGQRIGAAEGAAGLGADLFSRRANAQSQFAQDQLARQKAMSGDYLTAMQIEIQRQAEARALLQQAENSQWRPIEFAYNVATGDADRSAAAKAAKLNFYGGVVGAGGNVLGGLLG